MSILDQNSGLPAGGCEVFRTDLIVVRRWRSTDAPDLLALYGNKEVVRWIDDGQPLSVSEAAQWMEVTHSNYQKRGYGMFAIEDGRHAKTVGFGGLVHPGGQEDAEVKYAFAPAVWGKGFATDFVRALLKWAKSAHSLTRVIATVAPENIASQRVLIKSGFVRSEARLESDGSRTEVFKVRL